MEAALGREIPEEELKKMFAVFDTNHDNKISHSEFQSAMEHSIHHHHHEEAELLR